MEKSAVNEFSNREKRLILLLRDLQFGEVKVIVQDGQPIRAEEIKQSIKL
ncbi:MAG: DUF2292 domain-containing protein [Oscillospiraceae bacterium]